LKLTETNGKYKLTKWHAFRRKQRRYVKREMKIVPHRKIFANFSSDHNS